MDLSMADAMQALSDLKQEVRRDLKSAYQKKRESLRIGIRNIRDVIARFDAAETEAEADAEAVKDKDDTDKDGGDGDFKDVKDKDDFEDCRDKDKDDKDKDGGDQGFASGDFKEDGHEVLRGDPAFSDDSQDGDFKEAGAMTMAMRAYEEGFAVRDDGEDSQDDGDDDFKEERAMMALRAFEEGVAIGEDCHEGGTIGDEGEEGLGEHFIVDVLDVDDGKEGQQPFKKMRQVWYPRAETLKSKEGQQRCQKTVTLLQTTTLLQQTTLMRPRAKRQPRCPPFPPPASLLEKKMQPRVIAFKVEAKQNLGAEGRVLYAEGRRLRPPPQALRPLSAGGFEAAVH